MPPQSFIALKKACSAWLKSIWSDPTRRSTSASRDMSVMVMLFGVTPGLLELRVPAGAGTFVQNTFGLSNGVAAAAFTVPEGAACATAEPTDATSAVRTKTRNQRLLDMRNPSPWWS